MEQGLKIRRQTATRLAAAGEEFRAIWYLQENACRRHLALIRGDLQAGGEAFLRLHRRKAVEDLLRNPSGPEGGYLQADLAALARAGAGVLLYLDLPEPGEAEAPGELAAALLRDLGIRSVRLLTDPAEEAATLSLPGITVTARVPWTPAPPFPGDPALRARLTAIPEEARRCRERHGRPLVTLTYAQSLDGSIAARPGHPLAISGPASQTFTHALRAVHDAILVGIGTVLADNPALTVRLVPGPNPRPVIMDTRLRLPSYARLLRDGQRRPVVATAENADRERQQDLESLGAQVLRFPVGPNGGIHLPSLLARLAELGLTGLMVEGGAQVITSFLSARLVDQVVVTVAPILVGGLRVLEGYLPAAERNFPRLEGVTYHQVGEDLVLWGTPRWS